MLIHKEEEDGERWREIVRCCTHMNNQTHIHTHIQEDMEKRKGRTTSKEPDDLEDFSFTTIQSLNRLKKGSKEDELP